MWLEIVVLYNLQCLSAPSLIIWSLSKSANTKRDWLILEISSHFLKEKNCSSKTSRTKLLVMVKVALVLFVCSTSNSFKRQVRFQLFCCSRKRPIIKLPLRNVLQPDIQNNQQIKEGLTEDVLGAILHFTIYTPCV